MNFKPEGILPAMITPLTADDNINLPVLRQLINYLIDGGVNGIFAIGTTGEFYAMSNNDYRQILEATVDEVAGRVPVYAGANAISTKACVDLANIAQQAGVDALSVLTPYFINPTQEQVYNHFKTVAENTNLPILLYNNAPKTHVNITPKTAHELSLIPNIVGIKDSTGDLTMTGEYIRLTRGQDFSVMMGRDTMIYGALCYGATGGVAACANVAPKLVCDIYTNFKAGNHAAALEAQYKLAPLRIAFELGTFPAVIKESLEMLGIPVGKCYSPIGPLNSDEREKLKVILKEMELL